MRGNDSTITVPLERTDPVLSQKPELVLKEAPACQPMPATITATKDAQTEPDLAEPFRNAIRDKIEDNELDLPVLPNAIGQVMSLTNDLNAEISDLSALIHRDPALASIVLKISNSAAYAVSHKIVSLNQAIARLGMKLLGEVAIAVSLNKGIFSVKSFKSEIKLLWRHALISGVYAKEIARLQRANVETMFLCGMLHTIGKPVVIKLISDTQKELDTELPFPLVRQLVEEFHCELSSMIAESWNLPDPVKATCTHYQDFTEAPSFQNETAMTYVTDLLASWLAPTKKLKERDIRKDPVFSLLNFYPDEVSELINLRSEVLSVVQSMEV